MRQGVRAIVVLAVLAVFAALPAAASADAASYRSMVMADDPAGYWRLEEDPGAPLGRNEVPGGQRLRYFQHPLLDEDGAFAGSRGASAGFRTMLDLGPPVEPSGDSTYETWFKIQSGYDFEMYEHVIEVSQDWGVWIYAGHIVLGCTRGPWGTGPQLTDSKWHHIALRLGGGRGEVFVDGVKVIDTQCEYDRGWDRVMAGWGGGRVGWTLPSARAYDEMAMYARKLSDADIAEHAAARTTADGAAPPARAPLTGGAYTTEVLADRPFSYYRFEDRPFKTDGTPNRVVADSSGNGHHGDMGLGGMDRAPGPIASEARNLSFRPRGHGLQVTPPRSADLSVEVWVKWTQENPSFEMAWIGGGPRFAMYFNGQELSVLPYGLITLNDNLWNDQAWHHIVATKDTATDTLTIYRDGRSQRAVPEPNDAPYYGPDDVLAMLGGSPLTPGYCVDEVAVYERVLSAARVAAHYDAADAERATGGCGGTSDVRPGLRPPAPQNVSPPQARGVAEPGNLVWCDPGEWTGDPHHFRQLWYRDGVALGQSEWGYLVGAADDGHELTCRVVATGPGGDSVEVSSAPLRASGSILPPGRPHLRFAGEDTRAAITLTWDPSPADPVPADRYIVQFRDAGGAWHTASETTETSVILFNPPEGRMVYRVVAVSGATQSEPSPMSDPIMVDRTAPAAARLTVDGSPVFGQWYRDSVTARWAHDGDPDLADGTPGSGIDPASVPPATVTLSTTGVHRVSARLRDLAGNSALTERDIAVDADAPSLSLDCPAVAHVGAIANVVVNASDGSGSGLESTPPATLPIDTTVVGAPRFSLTVRDNVGHSTSDSCDVPVVHRRPNAPQLVAGTSPGDGAITLAWTRHPLAPAPDAYVLEGRDADDAGWTQLYRGAAELWSTPAGSPVAQGTWRFRVRVDDPDFDREPSGESAGVVVDRTAPSAPSISPDRAADASPDWFRDTVTLSFAGSGDPNLPDGSPGSGVDPSSVSAARTFATAGTHTASGTVRDRAGNTSASASRTVRVDTSAPSAAITCPAADVVQDASATASWTASDTGSGLAGAASGTVSLATGAIGTFTASPPAVTDRVGHAAPATSCSYRVIYDWTGFIDPVTSGPDYNRVDAGEIVPVMFSLDGDRGLGVLAGAPATIVSADCSGQRNDVSWTLPATWTGGLVYYAQYDVYLWPFRTQTSWRNTCRLLTVTLDDGTSHTAIFRFR